jgi:WD40 repeat protein
MWIQKVTGGIHSLTHAPDGNTLYVADGSGWVTAWELRTHVARKLFRLTATERESTVRLLASGDGQSLVTLGSGLRVWDSGSGVCRGEAPWEVNDALKCLDVARSRLLFAGTNRRTVWTWEFASCSSQLTDVRLPCGFLRGFALAPNHRVLVLIHTSETVSLFDPEMEVASPLSDLRTLGGTVTGALFSPDGGTLIVFVGGSVATRKVLFDLPTQRIRVEVPGPLAYSWVFDIHPTAPVFVALDQDSTLTLFNLETGRPLRSFNFTLGKQVRCVAFSPDGLTCAVGGSNKQFAVFDVDL